MRSTRNGPRRPQRFEDLQLPPRRHRSSSCSTPATFPSPSAVHSLLPLMDDDSVAVVIGPSPDGRRRLRRARPQRTSRTDLRARDPQSRPRCARRGDLQRLGCPDPSRRGRQRRDRRRGADRSAGTLVGGPDDRRLEGRGRGRSTRCSFAKSSTPRTRCTSCVSSRLGRRATMIFGAGGILRLSPLRLGQRLGRRGVVRAAVVGTAAGRLHRSCRRLTADRNVAISTRTSSCWQRCGHPAGSSPHSASA